VRVAILPYLSMVPYRIAAERGYFAEQNLAVEFVRLTRATELVSGLAAGDVDAAATMVTLSELNSVAAGARVRIVAATVELVPGACVFNAFVARREYLESGALQDPEQIRNMVFDINVLNPQGYWFDKLLHSLGLTIDDVEINDLPPAAGYEALLNGTIAAYSTSEPYISLLTTSGEVGIWLPTSELDPGHPTSVLMYGASLLDQRPGVGERFATAMLRAIRDFRRGKSPDNVALAAGFTGLSTEEVTTACWPTGGDDARFDMATIRGYQEWFVSRGLMDRALTEDELVDHRFIDAANARLAR
jgi:NitT/TauT family transport system substrate-binding protein